MLLGALFFAYAMDIRIINPYYSSWLMNGYDWSQHYLGWLFFKTEPWQFPLGKISCYNSQFGTSICYTDSIALLAIPLKLFRKLFPSEIQYFGLFFLSCFVLQGLLGFLLSGLFTKNRLIQLTAASFFIVSPVLVNRYHHTSLCAQWVILCALWFYLKEHEGAFRKVFVSWLTLHIVTSLIHPYLEFIILFVFIAHLFKLRFIQKNINYLQLTLSIVSVSIMLMFNWWINGCFIFEKSTEYSAWGFGEKNLDLLALFNPYGSSKLLYFMKEGSVFWAEGYNYLGLGGIILLFAAVVVFLKSNTMREQLRNYIPLLIALFLLTLIAIGNTVTVYNQILFEIQLSDRLSNLAGVFRSSGRLFWAAYYFIIYVLLYVVVKYFHRKSIPILIALIALQVFDNSDIDKYKKDFNPAENPIKSSKWEVIGRGSENVVIAGKIPWDDGKFFALYAYRHNMKINRGYVARFDWKALQSYVKTLKIQLKEGMADPKSVYIVSKDITAISQDKITCGFIDNFKVCVSKQSVLSELFTEKRVPHGLL